MNSKNEFNAGKEMGKLDHTLTLQLLNVALIGGDANAKSSENIARLAIAAAATGTPQAELADMLLIHDLLLREIKAGKTLGNAAKAVRMDEKGRAAFNRVLDGQLNRSVGI